MRGKLYTLEDCMSCIPCKTIIKDNKLAVDVVSDLSEFPVGIRSVPCLELGEDKVFGGEAVMKKLRVMGVE
jgi:hypothetical protein